MTIFKQYHNIIISLLYILLCFPLAVHTQSTNEQPLTTLPDWLPTIPKEIIDPLKEKYDALPPKGKFATGAFLGYTSSRMAMRTVVKGVKMAGTAFVVSEVLSYTGLLDTADDWLKDNAATVEKIQHSVRRGVNVMRVRVRRYINPKNMKLAFEGAMEADRMATLGFATGVASCLIL